MCEDEVWETLLAPKDLEDVNVLRQSKQLSKYVCVPSSRHDKKIKKAYKNYMSTEYGAVRTLFLVVFLVLFIFLVFFHLS